MALNRWKHLFKPLITQERSFFWKRSTELEMSYTSVEPKPRVLIVRMRQLIPMVGLSRSSIYRFISLKQFPAPIRLGDKAVGWRVDEIEDWINARPSSIDLYRRGK
jgi:prophage regulatory protein